ALAAGEGLPMAELGRIVPYFEHVMGGAEAQMLEGDLERVGAGSPETGPDDFECHVAVSPSYATRAGPSADWRCAAAGVAISRTRTNSHNSWNQAGACQPAAA